MVSSFLNTLQTLNVKLRAEGDKLTWEALEGVMTDSRIAQLKIHKAELLALLRDKQADAHQQGSDPSSTKDEQQQVDLVSEGTDKQRPLNTIILGDCLEKLKTIPDNSVDSIVTDPPFGIGFMGKAWDTFKPGYLNHRINVEEKSSSKRRSKHSKPIGASPASVAGKYKYTPETNKAFQNFMCEVSKECLRVLKPGSFMFMCMTPRQDSYARAIIAIEDAGFKIGFTSMYWTYASGFPKARNISKSIDKKLGAERKKLVRNPNSRENCDKSNTIYESGTAGKTAYYTEPVTKEAKQLDGSYAGFQPKPAVEAIIVAMKPCDKKTYTEQALSNGKGLTWLDDGRIPYNGKKIWSAESGVKWSPERKWNRDCKRSGSKKGRFPANMLVSDDVLGTNSKYFNLDLWFQELAEHLPDEAKKTFPFLFVPKASKKEKDAGLEGLQDKAIKGRDPGQDSRNVAFKARLTPRKNTHPTVKPIKLMAYLITIGSRENDVLLDPFAGSGTTCIAAKLLNRNYIGIELLPEHHEIAMQRVEHADKDNTIKKLIHEIFKGVENVSLEKNKNCKTKETLTKNIVCQEVPVKGL